VCLSLELRPDINFTIVVNPKSGPGDGPGPDERYTSAVKRLNSYANVQTVGYVRTGYASRNLSDVVDEINIFSGWSDVSSELAMQGIFLDESPHQYSAESVDFMAQVGREIKSRPGLKGPKTVGQQPTLRSPCGP
jgi:hypothetical protein